MNIFLGLIAYCIVVWVIAYLIIRKAKPVKEEIEQGAAVEHDEFNMYEREEFDL